MTDRRGFLRSIGALAALAIVRPVESLAAPPRKLLAARPSAMVQDLTSVLKRVYSEHRIEALIMSPNAFARLVRELA